jgi:hypothetical protein
MLLILVALGCLISDIDDVCHIYGVKKSLNGSKYDLKYELSTKFLRFRSALQEVPA